MIMGKNEYLTIYFLYVKNIDFKAFLRNVENFLKNF